MFWFRFKQAWISADGEHVFPYAEYVRCTACKASGEVPTGEMKAENTGFVASVKPCETCGGLGLIHIATSDRIGQ